MQQQEFNRLPQAGSGTGLPFQVDFGRLVRAVLRRIWIVVLVAVVLGGSMYVIAKNQTYEIFRAEITLAFTKTTYQTIVRNEGKEDEYTVSIPTKDYFTKMSGDRYTILLTGDDVVERVNQELNNKYDENLIRSSIHIDALAEAGFYTLWVQSGDGTFCNDVLNALIGVFPSYLTKFESTLSVDIIRRARPAQRVSNVDNSKTMTMLGAVCGGGAMITLFVLLELFRSTVRSGQDIRTKTAERLLGMTPFQPSKRAFRKKDPDRVIHILDKRSVSFDFVENIKAIRTKIENIAAESQAKVFVVTSTFEGEGKSTIVINLACALAQRGKSVLVIDCDLRKPAILKKLGIKEGDKAGILPILAGISTYEESVKYVKSLRFFVLSSGGVTANPTEKLSLDTVSAIFQKARTEFDFILVDTPPARVVADCISLAPQIDQLIFVVRYDYARIQQINETLDEIEGAGVSIAGVILTMAAPENLIRRNGYSASYRRPGKYYGGFGYGYGSGIEGRYGRYGYGYGQQYRSKDVRHPDADEGGGQK
ncbi:MAG: CpsD/CapB family tyrosine-protein kinase [Oscillospiraceae bacterium]|jgi:capsular exopolysaccharide synthesis family protein|nr:CpsD/CapB family tyrosine-protein kinase [Oscillospiraceae bacterium]